MLSHRSLYRSANVVWSNLRYEANSAPNPETPHEPHTRFVAFRLLEEKFLV